MSPSKLFEREQGVNQLLEQVIDLETGADVIQMGLVEDIGIDFEGQISYTFRPSSPLCPLAVFLAKEIKNAVRQVVLVSLHNLSK